MIKRYRAYDEALDKWIYFKIIATSNGWELHYLDNCIGDVSHVSDEENFNVAYDNMLRYVDELQLDKLTELSGSDL